MATTIGFFECASCKALYFSSSKDFKADFLCDRCMEKTVHSIEEKIIITCPKCKKYWPRYVIRAIISSGICTCPNHDCAEVLTIRGRKALDPTSKIIDASNTLSKNETQNEEITSDIQLETKDVVIEEAGGDDTDVQDLIKPVETESAIENPIEEPVSSVIPMTTVIESVSSTLSENIPIEEANVVETPLSDVIDSSTPQTSNNDEITSEIALNNNSNDNNLPENEEISKNIETSTPPDIPSVIDYNQYTNSLDESKIEELYRLLIADIKTADMIPPQEFHSIIKSMISTLDKNNSALIEEPIQFAFYIGNLYGDLEQTQRIIRYLNAVIETYPSMKAIFLGNYLNYNLLDFPTLALIYIFYLKYPNNIVLLRGTEEIKEKAEFEGFWTRFSAFFERFSINSDVINTIYQDLIISLGLLPIMHIGSMNQGQVRIFSAPSGIPINHDDPSKPFNLKEQIGEIPLRINHSADFPLIGQDLLWGLPDETLQEPISFDPESGRLHFSAGAYSGFLKLNKLHYMMRATDRYLDGVKYYFNYMICSVFSANIVASPKEEHFNGKIVRLTLGQPPNVISTDPADLLKDLEKTFGITDVDL